MAAVAAAEAPDVACNASYFYFGISSVSVGIHSVSSVGVINSLLEHDSLNVDPITLSCLTFT